MPEVERRCRHHNTGLPRCWMCREGETFTEQGADTLFLLNAITGMVNSTDRHPTKDTLGDERTLECLEYAYQAVVEAEWKKFHGRMHEAARDSLPYPDSRQNYR